MYVMILTSRALQFFKRNENGFIEFPFFLARQDTFHQSYLQHSDGKRIRFIF